MHDIGAVVWLILVIIGVVSSVMKKAKQQAAGARVVAPPAPPVAPAPAVRRFVDLSQAPVAPPVAPPAPAARAQTPRVPASQPAKVEVAAAPPRENASIRGIFGSRQTVVQAIVAAQVLGPPLAMQEHTLWSPRHNEPSI